MYFDTKIRIRRTQPPHNDDGGDSNVSDRLSIFKCPERAFGFSSTRALDDRELVAAEIYIFMNCAELDPYIKVHLPDYAGCPGDRVRLPDYADCPGDRVRLPDYVGCPGDRVCHSPSSVTFPIPFTSSYMYVSIL
ncbi:hypothetical protein Taro_032998 [Colocasia esculenta]|uniref:Uncharacterized protein n=1 Tax=Colocasia esculenta TaxID=4460 RepID=A0A843W3H2_COLES|nr:hypothetical protein [Colocasia esculenta]